VGEHDVTTRSLRTVLERRIQTLQARPSRAQAVFRVDTRLVDTLLCQAQVRDLPPVLVDEPPAMGGSNQAPTPVEMVLAALLVSNTRFSWIARNRKSISNNWCRR